jgi:GntR family transcriptional regulator/MocR family aminotransferase
MGTFSKALMPGLRVAYLVVPNRLVEPMRRCLRNIGAVPSVVVQWALKDFLEEGHLKAHVTRMTRLYRDRRDCLVDRLKREAADWLAPTVPEGGIQLPAYFCGKARGLDDRDFVRAMGEVGVEGSAMSGLYWSGQRAARAGVLLGYAASDEHAIGRGVQQLVALLSKMAP